MKSLASAARAAWFGDWRSLWRTRTRGDAPGALPDGLRRAMLSWSLLGIGGFCLVPWYASRDAVWYLAWPAQLYASATAGAGLAQVLSYAQGWLALFGVLPVVVGFAARGVLRRQAAARILIAAGAAGFAAFVATGMLAQGHAGWGLGPAVLAVVFAAWLAHGLALRGGFGGSAFVAAMVVAAFALIGLFTLAPAAAMFARAFDGAGAGVSLGAFAARLTAPGVWRLACLDGGTACGSAWNTLALGLVSAALCTGIGLALALLVVRTSSRVRGTVRAVAMLPIVTPPFVIGLAIILLFGRSGLVNMLLYSAFGVVPTRWIYGLHGVLLTQVLAFTPVAFLVLLGVVEGVSPVLEEAAQTLGAGPRRTFLDVSLPLMLPGLANAFLISFVESITDFGNPILLGGNASVLATDVFFSLVGSELNPGRAAALSMLLLGFAAIVFGLQRWVLSGADYTTVTARAARGTRPPLPCGVRRVCVATGGAWCALMGLVFTLVLIGGFVVNWGRDYTPTLRHYAAAFAVRGSGSGGIAFTGSAWNGLLETLGLALVVAPLTALFGTAIAWTLSRFEFAGRRALEFATLVALAVPGTVTGVAYVLCFNAPPLELTGTGAIIAACFLFRNLPVAVRAASAALAQVDRGLDDASATLGARALRTFRKIELPLLRSVLVGMSVYGFVRAMTTVSAVIFLVSADHELATTFVLNRIINGDYGVAIACSTVLIALSLVMIALLRRFTRGADTFTRDALPPVAAS